MASLNPQKVLSVHHWNDTLMSFTTTRDRGLRFKSGHFLMLGLPVEGKPLLRAFSIASAHYDDHLEFYAIKIPDGPLTSRLQHVQPGDEVLVGSKPTGTLVLNTLNPGRTLYLLATGTGLAPYMSIIRDPDTYDRYEHVVVAHGVRFESELGYADYIERELPEHPLVGEQVKAQLHYYPTVTREPFRNQGRLTELLSAGKLEADVGIDALDPSQDRVMLCGSPSMLQDLVELLEARGFEEGSSHAPASYTIERAFVER